MFIPLIKSKFKVTKLTANYNSRKKLITKLSNGLSDEKKLTLVIGNAGYGKSSLVSDYIQNANIPYFWYTLNDNDADLVVFINHLVKGLKLVLPNMREDSLELLLSSTDPTNILHNVMGLLIENLSEQINDKFIVVLDDYQFLRNSELITKAIEYFIEYIPENIQLILISRYSPNLKKIPQLRVRQQLEEITPSDLKLSKEELKDIIPLEIVNLLTDEELTKLYEKTEGWIGILILIMQTYKNDTMIKKQLLNIIESSQTQPVFDYLAYEIFELQDEKVKKFMLISSLLPKINKELCNELDLSDYIQKITYLKDFNLFNYENEEDYAYNPLFKDFLNDKAKETLPFEELKSIYDKIAHYFVKRNQVEEALDYFFLSSNYLEAEKILQELSKEFFNSNRIDTLNKLVARFPEEYASNSANLQIIMGEINRLWGKYNEALKHFEKAEELAIKENSYSTLARTYIYESVIHASKGENTKDLIEEALKIFPEDDDYGLAFAYNTKGITYLFGEKIAESLKYFEKALKHYEKINDNLGQAKVLHNLGFAYSMLGSFEHSRDTYERSIKQAESVGKYPYIMTYNNIAIIYNYSSNFTEARKFAEKALSLSQKLQYKRDMSYAYWTLGMISSNIEEYIKSEDYFNESLNIGLELGDRQVQAYALSGLSETARLQGKLPKALDLIDEAIRRRDLPLDNQAIIELLMQRVSIYIELKNFDLAKNDLEVYLLPKIEKLKYTYYLTHVCFYLLVVYEKLDRKIFENYLEKTTTLIKENNYYFFLNQQKYIPQELQATLNTQEVVVNVVKPSKIKFYCFGEFKTLIQDKVIPNKDWSGFKTKLALSYLLHNPKGVSKEQLANLLYPDTDITRTAINVILSRLRKAIEPELTKNDSSQLITFNDGKYFFNFGTSYWLDTEEFNYLLKELNEIEDEGKKILTLKKIVDLYSGDFLSEFSSELWVQIEKETYRRKIEKVFEELFNLYYKKGEYQEIILLSEKEITIDRCNENAFQRKIKAFIAMNKKEEALKQYKIMKNILKAELGVEPSQESRILYQSIGLN